MAIPHILKIGKNVAKRKSGGIAIAIRNKYKKYVTILETESKLVYWFVLSKKITKCHDILYGVTYVPPENSVYAIDDPYEEIQQEINSLSDKYSEL